MQEKRLIELEADPIANYRALDQIYFEMLNNEPESLERYTSQYLMKFASLSGYFIDANKSYLEKENDPYKRRWHLKRILQFCLFSNNLTAYNRAINEYICLNSDVSPKDIDFGEITMLTILEDSDCLTFLADDRTDINACKILIAGLSDVVRDMFELSFPKPKVFMLGGRGQSPFMTDLNCAFMMVGHYKGTVHEHKIFQTSITHEMTHLAIRKEFRLRIDDTNMGVFKFFDEGIAVQNSYRTLDDYQYYFAKFHNVAYTTKKYSTLSAGMIMDNWGKPIEGISPIQTYDYACAMMNFLDSKYHPKTCHDFFKAWISQAEVKTGREYFHIYYGSSLESAEQDWAESLNAYAPETEITKQTKIHLYEVLPDKIVFTFTSGYDLWPEQDIFCLSDQGNLLNIKSNDLNRYRFQNSGKFEIDVKGNSEFDVKKLKFIVLFGQYLEHLSLEAPC